MEKTIQQLKDENFRLQDTLNCQIELKKELERKIDNLMKEKEKEQEMIYKLTQKMLGM